MMTIEAGVVRKDLVKDLIFLDRVPRRPAPKKQGDFVLDKEQLDSLRLDSQNLKPNEREVAVGRVTRYHEAFLSIYGGFIANHTSNQDIADRVLIMDQDTYGQFSDHWAQLQSASYSASGSKGIMYTYLAHGKFTAGFHEDSWMKINQDGRDRLISRLGSEEEAREGFREADRQDTYIHEIAHHYQTRRMPYWFFEAGGFYYARTVMLEKFGIRFSADPEDAACDYYQGLVDKYGDDIHKVAFGQIQDDSWREKLSSHTDEVKQKVFPFLK